MVFPSPPVVATLPTLGADFGSGDFIGGLVRQSHLLADDASPVTTPPGAWVWINTGGLAAEGAGNNEVTGSAWWIEHDTSTQDKWWNGTEDCPYSSVVVDRVPGNAIRFAVHMAMPDAAAGKDFENVGIVLAQDGGVARYVVGEFQHNDGVAGGGNVLMVSGGRTGAVSDSDIITDAQAVTGAWIRATVYPNGDATIQYVLTGVLTYPAESSWVSLALHSGQFTREDTTLRLGLKSAGDNAVPSGQRAKFSAIIVDYPGLVTIP